MQGTRRGVVVVFAVASLLATAGVAAPPASAQYPSVSAPGWWIETLGPGQKTIEFGEVKDCVKQQVTESLFPETYYRVFWDSLGSTFNYGASCTRQWGRPGADLERQVEVSCTGWAENRVTEPGFESFGSNQQRSFFGCDVGGNGLSCQRDATLDQWVPHDCRPEIPGWPNRPTDVVAAECTPAEKAVKKAKRKLRRADGPGQERRAKKKLRRAKRAAKKACEV